MALKNKNVIKLAFDSFRNKVDELERVLPQVLADEAIKETKQVFDEQAFDGKPWDGRKNKKNNKRLLIKSRALYTSPNTYSYRARGFTLGSDLPYSGIHNWGGIINKKARIAVVTHKVFKKGIKKGKTLFAKNDKNATYSQKAKVGAYQINMPQRQFIGNTRRMRLRLYKAAKEEYKKIMR